MEFWLCIPFAGLDENAASDTVGDGSLERRLKA